MDWDSDEEILPQEDYYTFLNVSKEATAEEISNAYRRLSRIFHPDKHTDPKKKSKAEIMFNRTKQAYEVLSDSHSRAIYDNVGIKGLQTDGWEMVKRSKTPAEILAEFEKLAEEREERKRLQRTNPRGTVTVNINATDMFNPYDGYDDEYQLGPDLIPNIEVSGMRFTQSVDFPLTQKDHCTLSGQLQTRNGTGSGGVNMNWRHTYSHKSWAELELAAGNGPMISLKGFRTLTKRFFWNGGAVLQFTPRGMRPAITSTIGMQIDKYSVGYFTYNGGIGSLISASVVRDTELALYNFNVQFGLPTSYVFISYTKKMMNHELRLRIALKGGTFGGLLEYEAEKKVSSQTWLSASMSVGVPTGVKLKIKLTRANQVYSFPIHLCEELMPSPVFYGTVAPLIAYVVVKNLIVDPYIKVREAEKAKKQKEACVGDVMKRRKEALAAVELMEAAYLRAIAEEQVKNGLVIVKAYYGNLSTEIIEDSVGMHLGSEVIDVTKALQCLVKDSKLVLQNQSKSQLPGFFDPLIGAGDCHLLIIYNFHGIAHEVRLNDKEAAIIPKNSHRNGSIT